MAWLSGEADNFFRLMMVSCQLYQASEWLFWNICAVAGSGNTYQ